MSLNLNQMKNLAQSLERIVDRAGELKQIYKSDLQFGDVVLVTTLNSDYLIQVVDSTHYLVSGGWFDHNGLSPARLRITGCTWGGSIIKLDIIAACGLCIEFSNRVITSPVQQVSLRRGSGQN